jgi:type IV pilus assembly protein PilZ
MTASAMWTMGRGLAMGNKKDRRTDSHPVDEDRRLGRDRRKFERVLVDLEVDYKCEDTFLFAYITDISAMGIFVRTNNPEPVGSRINVRFSPPGMLTLQLEGEVIWINPYRPGDRESINPGMGIKFLDLSDDQKQQLTDLVKTFAYLDDDRDDEQGDELGGGTGRC